MKKRIFTSFCAVLLCISVGMLPCVNAKEIVSEENYVKLTIPDNFQVLTKDNIQQNLELIEKLGKKVDDVVSYFEKTNCVFDAFSEDLSIEILLSTTKDKATENIFNFSRIGNENQDKLKNALTDPEQTKKNNIEGVSASYLEHPQVRFVRTAYNTIETNKDGQKIYAIQYYTVYNGQSFFLGMTKSGEAITEEEEAILKDVFASLSFTKTLTPTKDFDPNFNPNSSTMMIIIVVAILLGIAALAYSNYRKKKKTPANYI